VCWVRVVVRVEGCVGAGRVCGAKFILLQAMCFLPFGFGKTPTVSSINAKYQARPGLSTHSLLRVADMRLEGEKDMSKAF